MMVWWYITLIVTTKHHLCTNLKVSYTIHKLWSTVVWLNLPNFITNSKLLKIFWHLPLCHLYVHYCAWKIINVYKQSLSTNPLSELRYDVSRWSCPSTPISYLLTINSPSIVQVTSNYLAQGCTVTCQIMFSWCPANLVWNLKKNMQELKFRVPFVKHRSTKKSLLASSKAHDGMRVH